MNKWKEVKNLTYSRIPINIYQRNDGNRKGNIWQAQWY